jgi:hypothetical protein
MDAEGIGPRLAIWVKDEDNGYWKLWLVPADDKTDVLEFYRRISLITTKHRIELCGVGTSDTKMLPADHPAAKGIGASISIPDVASVWYRGGRYDGHSVPEGIILRSNL